MAFDKPFLARISVPLARGLAKLCIVCATVLMLQSIASAQDPDSIAPPPIKMLSKTERAQLASKTEAKERTGLALQLMENRLRSAEKYHTDENYSLMYAELGGFQALMDNALNFLLKTDMGEGKRLNGLKKYEIGLRSFVPRLEGIRRDLPFTFEPYVRKLIKDIGDARERAMTPFFSDSVISNSTP